MQSIFSLTAFYSLAVAYRRDVATVYRGDFRKGSVAIENQTLQVVQDNIQISAAGENRASTEMKCCCEMHSQYVSREDFFLQECENAGALFLQSDDGAVCCKQVILPGRKFGKASCKATPPTKPNQTKATPPSDHGPLSLTKVQNPRSDFQSNFWTREWFMQHVPTKPVWSSRYRQPPQPPQMILEAALEAMSGKEVGLPWPSPSLSLSWTHCLNLVVNDSAQDMWIDVGAPYRYKIPAILAASVSALRLMETFPHQDGYLRKSPLQETLQELQAKLARGTVVFQDYDLSKESTASAASHITQVLKERFQSLPKKLLDFVTIPHGTVAQNLALTGKSIVSLQIQPTSTVQSIIKGQGSTMLENTPEPFRTTMKYWFDFLKQIVDGKNKETFQSVVVNICATMGVLLTTAPEILNSPAFAKFNFVNGFIEAKTGVAPSISDIQAAQELLTQSAENQKLVVCELWKAHFKIVFLKICDNPEPGR